MKYNLIKNDGGIYNFSFTNVDCIYKKYYTLSFVQNMLFWHLLLVSTMIGGIFEQHHG